MPTTNPPAHKNQTERKMNKLRIVSALAALTVIAAVGVAQAQKDKNVVHVSSASATYKPSPMAGVSMQVLRGDPDKGPHATFTKFDPGYDAGMHTHTNGKACWARRIPARPGWPQTLERRRQNRRRTLLSGRVRKVRPYTCEIAKTSLSIPKRAP